MKKNFIYNVIYQISILILPLITMPYISRTIGANGVGIYSYTYSIVYYFMLVAMLGLNNYGNRTIAKVRDNKERLSSEFCSIYFFQLIVSSTVTIVYFLYVFCFNIKYIDIAILQCGHLLSTIIDINWFYFGLEKFKVTITRNIIVKILSLVLIFVFVKSSNDLWKYTLILSLSSFISNIFLFTRLRKYIDIKKVPKKDIKKHIKPAIVLFIPVVAVSLYKVMDKIMIGLMSSVTEVGYYENAEKIIGTPLSIITALGVVMLPRVSNMISNNDQKNVYKILQKTMEFVSFLIFPMTFGVAAIGKDFSILFLGSQFEKSGYLIRILAVTIVFISLANVIRTQYLIPKEKDKDYILSVFCGAIVNLFFNLLLIPQYASIGACIATVLAELVVMLYQFMSVRKELPVKNYIKQLIPFFLKACIMFVIIILLNYLFKNILIKVVMQVTIGIIVYSMLNIKYILNNVNIKLKMEREMV